VRRRTFYRTRQLRGLNLLIGGFVIFVASVYFVRVLGWHDVGFFRRALGLAVFGGVIALAAFAYFWWLPHVGVYVNDDGVVLRSPFRSRRLRWSEIERFSVEPWGTWWTSGFVHLRDGSSIRISGLGGQNRALFPKRSWAQEPVDELNQLLRSHRGGLNQGREAGADQRVGRAQKADGD
jgi:hypothetical protein